MDRNQAIKKLRKEQENDDQENAHCAADGVLCDLLTELGYGDVVAEYAKISKWFA